MNMKKKSFRICIVIAMVGGLLLSTICLAQEKIVKPITLKSATFLTQASFAGKLHQAWADDLEKRTGGRVKIQMFWMGSLAKFEDMLQTIQSGVAEIGNISCQYNPSEFPLWLSLDMPYNVGKDYYAGLMANRETQQKEPNLKAEIEKAGVITVYPHMSGQIMIGTKKRPDSIKSLKGKTIRTLGAERIKWMTGLGLNPVTIAFSDIYEGISRGTIDAAEMVYDLGDVFKLYEVVKCITPTNSGNIIAVGGIMNLKVYNKLPKDIQAIIQDMFEEHAIRYARGLEELESVLRDKWTKQYGVTVQTFSSEDTKMMIEVANNVRESFIKKNEAEGRPGRKVWDFYVSARKRYEEQGVKKR